MPPPSGSALLAIFLLGTLARAAEAAYNEGECATDLDCGLGAVCARPSTAAAAAGPAANGPTGADKPEAVVVGLCVTLMDDALPAGAIPTFTVCDTQQDCDAEGNSTKCINLGDGSRPLASGERCPPRSVCTCQDAATTEFSSAGDPTGLAFVEEYGNGTNATPETPEFYSENVTNVTVTNETVEVFTDNVTNETIIVWENITWEDNFSWGNFSNWTYPPPEGEENTTTTTEYPPGPDYWEEHFFNGSEPEHHHHHHHHHHHQEENQTENVSSNSSEIPEVPCETALDCVCRDETTGRTLGPDEACPVDGDCVCIFPSGGGCITKEDCDEGDQCVVKGTNVEVPPGGRCPKGDTCFCATPEEEEVEVLGCIDADSCGGANCMVLHTLEVLPPGKECFPGAVCFCAGGGGSGGSTTPWTSTATGTTTTNSSTTTTATTTTATITTTRTTTSTTVPFCKQPDWKWGMDISDCRNRVSPSTCTVKCFPGWLGGEARYTCSNASIGFQGSGPTCTFIPVPCPNVPSGRGINGSENCLNKVTFQTCVVSCSGDKYVPASITMYCGYDGRFTTASGGPATCAVRTCNTGLPLNSATGLAMYNTSNCNGTAVGELCIVTCGAGYVPKAAVYTCNSDKVFSGTPPECVRIQCLDIPTGYGLNQTPCLNKYGGDSCILPCRDGFIGTPANLTCGSGSFYNNTNVGLVPTCSLRPCDIPDRLKTPDVLHMCTGVLNGQSCAAGCADGFVGSPQQLSCSAPTLVGTFPTCRGLTCTIRTPRGIGVNSTSCTGKTSGQNCTATCITGYQATGTGFSTCLANGSFSLTNITCARKQCRNLTSFGNFSLPQVENTCSGKVYNQYCVAYCGQGYVGDPMLLTCSADGTYRDAYTGAQVVNASTCNGLQCRYRFPNGRGVTHNCTGKTTGEKCSAWASPGYTYLAGYAAIQLTCQPNRVFAWSAGLKVKPMTCATPTFATGVSSTCRNTDLGSWCVAYCAQGFTGSAKWYQCALSGSTVSIQPWKANITCSVSVNKKGSTNELLRSAGVCSSALVTPTGVTSNCAAQSSTGFVCTLSCDAGYTGNANDAIITYSCGADGAWSGSGFPTCTANNCTYSLPDGTGVAHNCTNASTGQTCLATCSMGYSYQSGQSAANFTCTSTGEFNGTSPTCVPAPCNALVLDAGYRTTNCAGKKTGETCTVDCNDGWTLQGSVQTFTCEATSNFSGSTPTCVPVRCTKGIPTDSNLNVPDLCSALNTTQSCQVSCANGYTGSPKNLTCTPDDATLSSDLPTCSPATCANLTAPSAGVSSNCQGISFSRYCTATCGTGYKLPSGANPQQIQCSWDSSRGSVQLQGTFPTCTALPCMDGIPTNPVLQHNCSSTTTGSICQSSCRAGYTGGAPSTLYCGTLGLLTGSSPTCTAMTCPDPMATDQYKPTLCSQVTFGSTCFYTCNTGFTGSAKEMTCSVDPANSSAVKLTGALPTCTGEPCLYNYPVGAQFSHNCSGVTTAVTCSVGCNSDLEGTPSTFVCAANNSLTGEVPTCRTTTRTSSTTTTVTSSTSTATRTWTGSSTTITTTATTTSTWTGSTSTLTGTTVRGGGGGGGGGATTTTVEGRATTTTGKSGSGATTTSTVRTVAYTITGSMTMTVSDPAAFVAEPGAVAAVEAGIASFLNISADYVSANLTLVTSRRLLDDPAADDLSDHYTHNPARQLATTAVRVDYEIVIPADEANAPNSADLQAKIVSATPDSMTVAITVAIATSLGAGRFTITVTSISAPVVYVPGNGGSGGGGGSATEEDDGAAKRRKGAIAAGVLGGFFGFCCLMCIGARLFVLYRRWQKRRPGSPNQGVVPFNVEVGPDVMVPVLPGAPGNMPIQPVQPVPVPPEAWGGLVDVDQDADADPGQDIPDLADYEERRDGPHRNEEPEHHRAAAHTPPSGRRPGQSSGWVQDESSEPRPVPVPPDPEDRVKDTKEPSESGPILGNYDDRDGQEDRAPVPVVTPVFAPGMADFDGDDVEEHVVAA